MDRIVFFQRVLGEIIEEYARLKPVNLDVQPVRIKDVEGGHYQLLWVGWGGNNRVFSVSFHVDIKEGKLYIQEDRTEGSIAAELKARGVQTHEIVRCYREKVDEETVVLDL